MRILVRVLMENALQMEQVKMLVLLFVEIQHAHKIFNLAPMFDNDLVLYYNFIRGSFFNLLYLH